MTQVLHIHPINPQQRLLNQVVQTINKGGVIVYPTDSAYALGCQLGNKQAQERIAQLRHLDKHHNFTLACKNLSELATYARVVDNSIFRFLKAHTPGPYTFILPATQEVPRRLQHAKRKTIGIRIPDNVIAQALLSCLGQPLMSSTLILPPDELPLVDLEKIYQCLKGKVDLIIDGGPCSMEPTTVVDLTEVAPIILRKGKGEIDT